MLHVWWDLGECHELVLLLRDNLTLKRRSWYKIHAEDTNCNLTNEQHKHFASVLKKQRRTAAELKIHCLRCFISTCPLFHIGQNQLFLLTEWEFKLTHETLLPCSTCTNVQNILHLVVSLDDLAMDDINSLWWRECLRLWYNITFIWMHRHPVHLHKSAKHTNGCQLGNLVLRMYQAVSANSN